MWYGRSDEYFVGYKHSMVFEEGQGSGIMVSYGYIESHVYM